MSFLKKEQLIVAYNDSRSVLENINITEGGPARFSFQFRDFFSKKVTLKPLIFSYIKEKGFLPELKKHKIGKDVFFEVVYDATDLHLMYKGDFSKSDFNKELSSVIDLVVRWFQENEVNLVFLNGFSLMNWVFLKAAHIAGLPIVSQHAGVWKKEIFISGQGAFSAQTRKAFYDMERDLFRFSTHHIFLNNFTKKVFSDCYNCVDIINKKSSVVPLPIDFKNNQKRLSQKGVQIGMVARWDKIKNPSAFLRLAESKYKPEDWDFHSVVKISPTNTNPFVKKYKEFIKIHEPMDHNSLAKFYKGLDLLILPSHFETFGGVAAESFLSDTPVIVSKNAGFSEILKKFQLYEHIIDPSISGKKMVKTIEQILKNKDRNKKKYDLLIQYLKKEHNPEKVFSAYSTIFTKVANKKSN